jgi:hypothetical protein
MQNFRSALKTAVVTCRVASMVLFRIWTGRERFIPSGQRLNGSTYLLHVKCPVVLWSSEFSTLTFQRNSMKCSSTPQCVILTKLTIRFKHTKYWYWYCTNEVRMRVEILRIISFRCFSLSNAFVLNVNWVLFVVKYVCNMVTTEVVWLFN